MSHEAHGYGPPGEYGVGVQLYFEFLSGAGAADPQCHFQAYFVVQMEMFFGCLRSLTSLNDVECLAPCSVILRPQLECQFWFGWIGVTKTAVSRRYIALFRYGLALGFPLPFHHPNAA